MATDIEKGRENPDSTKEASAKTDGDKAYDLIKNCRKAVGETPEFREELAKLYFQAYSHEEYSQWRLPNPFEVSIFFEKGSSYYRVNYSSSSEFEEVSIEKFHKGNNLTEFIFVRADVNRESRKFDEGRACYQVLELGERIIELDDKFDSVSRKIGNFLADNFPQQPQPASQVRQDAMQP
ncbi:MAG: hypothetical protein Q8P80_02260 [Candidatus Levybacteria bacterium]|nr:hypothetical protein [Candidatus Levybacteria bacterium]